MEKRLFGVDSSESLALSSGKPGPLAQILSAEQGKTVRQALGSLPDRFRVPLVLAYYNEYSYDQIAAVMRIPRNTVATLLFRGWKLLAREIQEGERL